MRRVPHTFTPLRASFMRLTISTAFLLLLAAATTACAQEAPRHPVVAVGAPELRTARITAGVDTLRVQMVTPQGMREIGSVVLETTIYGDTIRRVEHTVLGGEEVHRDDFTVSRRGLAPSRQRERSGADSTALAFRGVEVSGRTVVEGRSRDVSARLPRAVFHANQMDLILRALPLSEGYAASVPLFDVENEAVTWLHLRVTGQDALALTRGGRAQAWRVETERGGIANTYWVEVGSQALLRHASRTPQGDTILLVR